MELVLGLEAGVKLRVAVADWVALCQGVKLWVEVGVVEAVSSGVALVVCVPEAAGVGEDEGEAVTEKDGVVVGLWLGRGVTLRV